MEPQPGQSRNLSCWGGIVVTVLFFVALVGAIVAMVKGMTKWQLGGFLAFVLCGGWVVGRGLGNLFGWPMFRVQNAAAPIRATDSQADGEAWER